MSSGIQPRSTTVVKPTPPARRHRLYVRQVELNSQPYGARQMYTFICTATTPFAAKAIMADFFDKKMTEELRPNARDEFLASRIMTIDGPCVLDRCEEDCEATLEDRYYW